MSYYPVIMIVHAKIGRNIYVAIESAEEEKKEVARWISAAWSISFCKGECPRPRSCKYTDENNVGKTCPCPLDDGAEIL